MTKTHLTRLYLILAALGLLLLFIWPTFVQAFPLTAQHRLARAWTIAGDMGQFSYHTQVVQTTRPTNLLVNAGRQATTQHFQASGQMDRPNEVMYVQLTVPGKQPLELKVERGQTFARTSANGTWEEVVNQSDIFAPGGDPLGFLVAAENVVEAALPLAPSQGAGELTSPPLGGTEGGLDSAIEQAIITQHDGQVSRFTFDLNGPRYADYMRQELEAVLRAQGELPPGLNLGVVRQFAEMNGHGEIWLDSAGLPIRQVIHMALPPERGAQDRIEVEIVSQFSDWQVPAQMSSLLAPLWENPKQLWHTANLWTVRRVTADNLQHGGVVASVALLLTALIVFTFTHRHSRRLYGGVVASVTLSMIATPLMQAQNVQAFVAQQSERQAEAAQQQAAHNAIQAQATGQNQDAFDPQRDPLTAPDTLTSAPTLQYSNAPMREANLSCDDDTDSDGDGLSDYVECYKTATYTDTVDSDADGISDQTEVQGGVQLQRHNVVS